MFLEGIAAGVPRFSKAEFEVVACGDATVAFAGVNRSVIQRRVPVKFNAPSKTSMRATQNYIDSPRRGGITTPKIMIADPTRKMVSVCPRPHNKPIIAELPIDCCRLTIVDTATT